MLSWKSIRTWLGRNSLVGSFGRHSFRSDADGDARDSEAHSADVKTAKRRLQLRRMRFEMLCDRQVMAADFDQAVWQSSNNPLDVDNDGFVAAQDVLLVANQINATSSPSAVEGRLAEAVFDVNGDSLVTSDDALAIIDFINQRSDELSESRLATTDVVFGGTDIESLSEDELMTAESGPAIGLSVVIPPGTAAYIIPPLDGSTGSSDGDAGGLSGAGTDIDGGPDQQCDPIPCLNTDGGSEAGTDFGTETGGDTGTDIGTDDGTGDDAGEGGLSLGGDDGGTTTGTAGSTDGIGGLDGGETLGGASGGDIGGIGVGGIDGGGTSAGETGGGAADSTTGGVEGSTDGALGGTTGGGTVGDTGGVTGGSNGGTGTGGSAVDDGGSDGGSSGSTTGDGSGVGGTTGGTGGTTGGTGGTIGGTGGTTGGSGGTTGGSGGTTGGSGGTTGGTGGTTGGTGGTTGGSGGTSGGSGGTSGGSGGTTGGSGGTTGGINCDEFWSENPEAPCAIDDPSRGETLDVARRATLEVNASGVLQNDIDREQDALTAQLVQGTSHGTVTLNSNGSFSYRPNASFVGTDRFTYRASDGSRLSNLATVVIEVVNSRPVAEDDSYTAIYETRLVVNRARGVLNNDVDSDGDPLTVVLVENVEHGTLQLDPSGSFRYTPELGFTGTDSFKYRANDDKVGSELATVTIEVVLPLVDLDADSDNSGVVDRSPHEEFVEMNAPGRIILLNNDDDNASSTEDHSDVPFRDSLGNAMDDNDLLPIVFSLDEMAADLTDFVVSFRSPMNLWKTADKQPFQLDYVIGSEDLPETAFVEAIQLGRDKVEVILKRPDGSIVSKDEVQFSVVDLNATAFRPKTSPFQRWKVPEPEEDSVGIRINLDDDNQDLTPDANGTGSVSGENDLIEIELAGNSHENIQYRMVRSSSAINVFRSANRLGPVLFGSDSSVIVPGTFWVEWKSLTDVKAQLSLEVVDTTTGNSPYAESLGFKPFTSVVIVFNGEFQVVQDPALAGDGIVQFAIEQYRNSGYDVHLFDEDSPVRAWNEVVNAVKNRGVNQIAIMGYSHGGGTTYKLSERIAAEMSTQTTNPYSIPLTGYIDAVRQPFANVLAETRRPTGTQFHCNQYQRNGLVDGAASNGDDDIDRTPLGVTHTTIDEHPMVLDLLRNRLYQKVRRFK